MPSDLSVLSLLMLPQVQSDIKQLPFKVLDKTGKPDICVKYRGEDKDLCVICFLSRISEILTMLIVSRRNLFYGPFKMKETAEVYLGGTIANAVTVSA